MFTGIVEELGLIHGIKKGTRSSMLTIQGDIIFKNLQIGDSVAVNGVCLTVTSRSENTFTADVMHETLKRSNLGEQTIGCRVNLERALPADGRFGGHIVSGHIDGTGIVTQIKKDDNAILYTIKTTENIIKYIVEKGSIAIDGVSLTVAGVSKDSFFVSLIPHTVKATVFSEKKIGDSVNLENDIVGKYVEKLMGYEQKQGTKSNISKEFLLQSGYIRT